MNHTYPADCTTPEQRKKFRVAARKAASSGTINLTAELSAKDTAIRVRTRRPTDEQPELRAALVFNNPCNIKEIVAAIKTLPHTHLIWQQFRPIPNQEVVGISTRLHYAELQRLVMTNAAFNPTPGFENPHEAGTQPAAGK